MATTRIMPLHIGKGRTESQAISDIIDYVSNPQKADNGRLVTGFLILFTIQHKGISHYTFRITIIGIDKPFTDRRFLDFFFYLFGKCVKKTLVLLYIFGINTELHFRFSGYECCQSPFTAV